MAVVLGVNAVFHDPAAALVVDGEVVAAAEEERFNRRKHGKTCVPFSTWEIPENAIRWALADAGMKAGDIDAVAYSYAPDMCRALAAPVRVGGSQAATRPSGLTRSSWDPHEDVRTMYAEQAQSFIATAIPHLDAPFHHVRHHIAHAASAHRCSPYDNTAVLVLDGRGETTSHLAGDVVDGVMDVLAMQGLPHSIGLLYEEVTDHLGFRRSSDEFKVMALASHGDPERFASVFAQAVRARPDGGFDAHAIDLERLVPRREAESDWNQAHADLAAAMQHATETLILDLGRWLHERTGQRHIVLAGGVALNCVANGRLAAEGPFEDVWVQPAAGDSGTALGAAVEIAFQLGDTITPMSTAALGRHWSEDRIANILDEADLPYERPDDLADVTAEVLATNGVVGWFEGRSEFGPRALGHRSLLVDPRHVDNLQRMNRIKGREEFRPVAPMVLADRAAEIFEGVLPSPYMLFVHQVRPEWRDRIPAAVHVDGTARIQTVDDRDEPLMAAVLRRFEARTGVPVLVNTSFNTAGRPMVDSPVDALECFGSGPIDLLVLAPFVVRRRNLA